MDGSGLEMDVTGINYCLRVIDGLHEKYPDHPIIGSENNSTVTTRGCYKTDKEHAQVLACYDEEMPKWGSSVREAWDFARKRDYFAGIFIWTGFDYRGEPTPFTWPSVSSQFGIMDTCGFAKDSFYLNKACFTEAPMIHLLPHWTHEKGESVRVVAITNCDEAELFLNGVSLGRKPADVCEPPEWQVEYVPGKISAKAYRNGKCVAKAEQRTAGKPYAIRIDPDTTVLKNDGHDTAVINFAVVDKKGVVVPHADNLLHFEITGDGYVRGVGNGNPNSHESDVLPERRAFGGLCQALITAKTDAKKISLRAWSEGLAEAVLDFEVEQVPQPICPKDVTNYILDGFTMSAVTTEKPDPLMEIAGDDMNSFVPIQFVKDVFQKDFTDGWRIYRVQPKTRKDGIYKLDFVRARFRYAEIYVDGKQVDLVDTYTRGKYVTKEFPIAAGQNPDIRILLYVENESAYGAGISGSVEMKETL